MRTVLALTILLATPAFAEEAGGLNWQPAKAWVRQPDRPMRAATYEVPAAKGDSEPAELAVFYFGQGQGGDVDANIRRWAGQFETPDGTPVTRTPKTRKLKVAGLPVTTVDVQGTYTASMGPMSPVKTKKPGYRLLGAIVEGPEGAVFFKLTGPEKTVASAKAAFDAMVKSIRAVRK